ncbi:MAG: four-carbon acid sugar kinase family protein [Bacteroidales bacterium]|nr:four-carbon acid sugar kinase family protein [Bacteroidales bacterium]
MSYKKKIVVIADDFTGAAEIGGIGLRHGMNVIIETEPIDNKKADILIVATDSRSMNTNEAEEYIAQITRQIIGFHPQFIFKKIDSALRGNITEELVSQMKVMQKNRTIIIAANPVFNRIIKNGRYFINNVPLDQTCFANDLQFPIQSSDVLMILKNDENYPVINLKPDDLLPEKGLIVGDVENSDDLYKWAVRFSDNTLFAGASGFFDSLLKALRLKNGTFKTKPVPFGRNTLVVLGSPYPKDDQLLLQIEQHGHLLLNMPVEIYNHKNYSPVHLEEWVSQVVSGIEKHHKVIVASMHSNNAEAGLSVRIRQVMAELVKKVASRITLNEILIEGGSTTSEILKQMNIKKLIPIHELDTGVIRMQVDSIPGLFITTKPGSYLWPENVWLPDVIDQFNSKVPEC